MTAGRPRAEGGSPWAGLPRLATAESAYLKAHDVNVVVGDIPPLAFVSAAMAGLPAVAIGNFTWDWIYEGYPDASTRELARDIRRSYQTVTRVLRLPMALFSSITLPASITRTWTTTRPW